MLLQLLSLGTLPVLCISTCSQAESLIPVQLLIPCLPDIGQLTSTHHLQFRENYILPGWCGVPQELDLIEGPLILEVSVKSEGQTWNGTGRQGGWPQKVCFETEIDTQKLLRSASEGNT